MAGTLAAALFEVISSSLIGPGMGITMFVPLGHRGMETPCKKKLVSFTTNSKMTVIPLVLYVKS